MPKWPITWGARFWSWSTGTAERWRRLTRAALAAQEAFSSKGCAIAATIINRIDPQTASETIAAIGDASDAVKPVYALPETPALENPTIGEIADSLGATRLYGEAPGLNREVRDFKVAAMNLANFLNFVESDDLVITRATARTSSWEAWPPLYPTPTPTSPACC
jgi:phosphate acetyltransferase